MRLLLFLLLGTGGIWTSQAQTDSSPPDFLIRNWQSEDGLPGNVVRSIVQSTDGFLWIATAEGVVRFDGMTFDAPEANPDIMLPRGGPIRLFATPGGLVWYSSFRGGLLRIKQGRLSEIWQDRTEPNSPQVTQLLQIDEETIIAKRGEELWNVASTPPLALHSPSDNVTRALADDLLSRKQTGRILPDGNPATLIDPAGRRWSSTKDQELAVQDSSGKDLPLDLSKIDGPPAVSELLGDTQGNIWIASAANGLIRIRESRTQVLDHSDGLADRSISAVLEDSQGTFWVGSRSTGVDRIIGDTVEHFEFQAGSSGTARPVSVIYEDRDEKLWIAARDGSVYQWNGKELELQFFRQADPSKVDAIFHDAQGFLWFGGSRGLVRAAAGEVVKVGPEAGFPHKHVTAMSGDVTGRLWFGTADGCIYRENNGRIIPVGDLRALGPHRVTTLYVVNSQYAWAGTLGSGLHFWDGSRWHQFDRQHGLPDSRLTCIIPGNAKYLWLASLGGIFRIPQPELLNRLKDPDAPLHWLRFDRTDGLPTRECNGSARPAGWRDQSGILWFPTAKGLVRLDPSQVKPVGNPPRVLLREFRANGRPHDLSQNQPITVGPGHTRLAFAYHGLDLSAPEKTAYRTRLLPLDKTWQEAGSQRETPYTAVPPGHYTFEVMAISGEGLWSDAPATLEVIVSPRFWQTRWFLFSSIFAAIFIAVGSGWFVARSRLKRRIRRMKVTHARETERARIARDLHDDLGASVTEISLLAALGAEQQEKEPLQHALQEVSSKTNTLVGSLDEIVWAINPREDTLRSLVEYLAAFCEEFLSHTPISPRFEIARNLPQLAVDSTIRHSIFLAFREACNNMVRHSDANNARLEITWSNETLGISLHDDGRGIPEHVILGDGLGNLRSRMQDCGGTCDIKSHPDTGTTILFTIPFPPRTDRSK